MRRTLAILLFATAAAAATAAGSGVVLAPHIDPPGTPFFHTHGLAAYRLPLFLNIARLSPEPLRASVTEESLFELAGTLVLALLALAVPRLPRPALREIADLAPARVATARSHAATIHGPPRAALHA